MRAISWLESPLPVLAVLLGLFAAVQLLHWSILSRADRPLVVEVPARAPGAAESGRHGSTAAADSGAPAAAGLGEPPAGPLHAAGRDRAAAGEFQGALRLLDASLAGEGRLDAARLQERALIKMRLGRFQEATADLREARRLGEGSAALFFNLGLAHAKTGDLASAEEAYRQSLRINDGFDEAWLNLGLLLEQRADQPGALAALRRAVASAPSSRRHVALGSLARLLAAGGGRAEAVALAEEAIRLAPADPRTRLTLAAILATDFKESPRVRRLQAEAIRLAPEDPSVRFGVALFESRAGDRAAAEREYRRALELDPAHRAARHNLGLLLLETKRAGDAALEFETLLRQEADAKAWFGLARARRALGDLAGAESAYREASRVAADGYPEALYNLGLLLAESGKERQAESAYREAVRRQPRYAAAWINLTVILSEAERLPEALQASVRAVESDPANEKAWFLRGRLLTQAKRPEEALHAYEQAIALVPGYAKALLNAAVLHAAAGRDGEAVRLYRQVLATDARNAVAWFNLGLALARIGKERDALEAYERAWSADPEMTRAAQNLGVLHARAGRVEEARAVFAAALERRPDDAGLRYNLALQLEKLGRAEAAAIELQRVVHLDPRHPRAWGVLARVLKASGREKEAQRAWARAEATEGKGTAAPPP